MFVDVLNPMIAKKSMKESWKIKRKNLYIKKETIAKLGSLQTKERLQN